MAFTNISFDHTDNMNIEIEMIIFFMRRGCGTVIRIYSNNNLIYLDLTCAWGNIHFFYA